jgi:hypothetical protein
MQDIRNCQSPDIINVAEEIRVDDDGLALVGRITGSLYRSHKALSREYQERNEAHPIR